MLWRQDSVFCMIFRKGQSMIDIKYIEEMVNGCPEVDFAHDSNGVISDPTLSDYIDRHAKAMQKMMPESLSRLQREKLSSELAWA
jgi:hypothetical protein